MKTQLLRLFIASLVFWAANTSASVRYVDVNNTNPVPPYVNWSTAATNIQDAINVSGYADTILVTNGIYQFGGASYSGSDRVYANNSQTIQSVNGPAFTTIVGYQVPGTTNGASAVRCVYLQTGATLSGFTLRNGATQNFDYGGGIKCASTNCLVINCVITGNAAYDGGGGAYSGTLVNCSLTGNSADASSVANGGGAYNGLLVNCVLAGNFSQYVAGAAAFCTLINCTVVSNSAAAYDGSLDACMARNCVVYYNFSYYTNADTAGGGYFTNCCTSFAVTSGGANNFTNPPLFANLAAGDLHLNAASPCINAGNSSFITNSADLDGNPRIVGGVVDIGAYEFQWPVHYVALTSASPISPYTNWLTAATNIQDAIDAADAGDFVVVSNGIYNSGGRVVNGSLTNRVAINKGVTVQSVNGPLPTVIAGLPGTGGYFSTGYRCVYLTNGAALIGFTLTNGATRSGGTDIVKEQSGAAVWCESISATISNCVLTHSYANEYGGGAYSGTLNNCVVSNNQAFISGGGAYNSVLNNCLVTSNRLIQGSGGGGAAYGALSNCLVTWNAAPGNGGGAYFSTLNNCVVSNNSAGGFGGGVSFGVANNSLIFSNNAYNGGGAYSNVLNNCVLQNNSGSGAGGGGAYQSVLNNCVLIANRGGKVGGGAYQSALNNCTVVGNFAFDGGGISSGGATNCIIYYNTAVGSTNYYGGAMMNYCDTTPFPTNGSGNIINEPAFVDLSGGDFHLQSNSPCINSGNNAYVTGTSDSDGNSRIRGGTVDIGAYEYQTPASVISYAWLQQYGLPTDGSADDFDSDGDGMNNYQEWIAGTDPTDALSILKMLTLASTNSPSGLVVSWQSVSNRTYFLQGSTNLGIPPAFSIIQYNIAGQAGTTSFTDTNAVGFGPYFYRVGVQ